MGRNCRDFKPTVLAELTDSIVLGNLNITTLLKTWTEIWELLRLGIDSVCWDITIPNLFMLIVDKKCEVTREIRNISLKVAYTLMLRPEKCLHDIVLTYQDLLFRILLYGFMDPTISLRITSELCLIRILRSVLSAEEAFQLVLTQLTKSSDLENPDVCKMLNWTVDRLTHADITLPLQKEFLDAFEQKLTTASALSRRRMMAILNNFVTKTDEHFLQMVEQMLVRLTARLVTSKGSKKKAAKA